MHYFHLSGLPIKGRFDDIHALSHGGVEYRERYFRGLRARLSWDACKYTTCFIYFVE